MYGIVLVTHDGEEMQHIDGFESREEADEQAEFMNCCTGPLYEGIHRKDALWSSYRY